MSERRGLVGWKLSTLLLGLLLSNLGAFQEEKEEQCECDEEDKLAISLSGGRDPVLLYQGRSETVQFTLGASTTPSGVSPARAINWAVGLTPNPEIVQSYSWSNTSNSGASLTLSPPDQYPFEEERRTSMLVTATDQDGEVGPFKRWLTIKARQPKIEFGEYTPYFGVAGDGYAECRLGQVFVKSAESSTIGNWEIGSVRIVDLNGAKILPFLEAHGGHSVKEAWSRYAWNRSPLINLANSGILVCSSRKRAADGRTVCTTNSLVQTFSVEVDGTRISRDMVIPFMWVPPS